jgi:hypothetical protein
MALLAAACAGGAVFSAWLAFLARETSAPPPEVKARLRRRFRPRLVR